MFNSLLVSRFTIHETRITNRASTIAPACAFDSKTCPERSRRVHLTPYVEITKNFSENADFERRPLRVWCYADKEFLELLAGLGWLVQLAMPNLLAAQNKKEIHRFSTNCLCPVQNLFKKVFFQA